MRWIDDDDVEALEEAEEQQQRFAVFASLAGIVIEEFVDDPGVAIESVDLAERYGPLWAGAEMAYFPPSWEYEWDDGYYSWHVDQCAVLVRGDLAASARCTTMTEVVLDALARAVESWAKTDACTRHAITAVLEDARTALATVPRVRLWEAGLVPARVTAFVNVVDAPAGHAWVPQSYRQSRSVGAAGGDRR